MVQGEHVCSCCKREIPAEQGKGGRARSITGTVCDDCLYHIGAQSGMPIRDFLDGLDVPVLLVDSDAVVKIANKAVHRMLHKDISQLQGHRGGEVFECAYARLPGGCGRTVHCSGCAIRQAVMHTFLTGEGYRGEPAVLTRQHGEKYQQVDLLISTEKTWNMVLLKIDSLSGGADLLPEALKH